MDNVMTFAKVFQRTITTKGICEINRSFLVMLENMFHQFVIQKRKKNLNIDPSSSVTLQQAQNNTFARCTTSTFSFYTFGSEKEFKIYNLPGNGIWCSH